MIIFRFGTKTMPMPIKWNVCSVQCADCTRNLKMVRIKTHIDAYIFIIRTLLLLRYYGCGEHQLYYFVRFVSVVAFSFSHFVSLLALNGRSKKRWCFNLLLYLVSISLFPTLGQKFFATLHCYRLVGKMLFFFFCTANSIVYSLWHSIDHQNESIAICNHIQFV